MELNEIETILADKPDALAAVKGWHERAGRLTPELEGELPKLGEYKTASERLAAVLAGTGAKDHDALVGEVKTLRERVAAAAAGKGGKGTDTPEYRALQEQLAELTGKLDGFQRESAEAKAAAAKAAEEKREADLRGSVIATATDVGVADTEEFYLVLKARGLIGHGEDGRPFYRKLNEKGEQVAVSGLREAAEAYTASRKHLLKASGAPGTGGNHKGAGGDGAPAVTNKFSEAKANFIASRMAAMSKRP